MPLALLIIMGLYIWLVLRRAKGFGGAALDGDEGVRAEKLLRFMRVGLMLASIVLAASIILASGRERGGGLAHMLRNVGGFFGADSQAAALPFFVIIGTVVSYGYTIVAAAKTVGFQRWLSHRRGA